MQEQALMELAKTFIKKLSALEPSKTPQEKFRGFCELAYWSSYRVAAKKGPFDVREFKQALLKWLGKPG